ncbi:bifunctional [glutamine synthetase] adenylyltransferase/[glutamine synthetase]-adenylyl-L-tyrosine phosphorylase [uncultured Microbacterium sp.]|uniref:bifunctional [glutamine synthetase] adenylyltransferase/[glutamine synthetase]-adenylyl-L-tyrosine phosphorylase n=1 Tax=uncultured Microbacterium sp. TaxID=191216 RepID=UPI0025E4E356|nr:bifunctional [glutamine synthetase] adenylyltransferase/[glutamine synthetase]-adenylyl-L-tyrosine phosphorylase [uncultured Microbacterium sp.]
MTPARSGSLTGLARLGFAALGSSGGRIEELETLVGAPREEWIGDAAGSADPDAVVESLVLVARRRAEPVARVLADPVGRRAVWVLLGVSDGFGAFYARHPDELLDLLVERRALPSAEELREELLSAIDAHDADEGRHAPFAADGSSESWNALRVAYRRMLARIAVFDALAEDPVGVVRSVSGSLADAAGAALEASLAVARRRISSAGHGPGALFPHDDVASVELAIIGMGKTGARELNYVSDVDVIFVGGAPDDVIERLGESRVIDIATRLAVQTMRGLGEFDTEPPLWEVDANLRPEGKQGALVRSLASHVAYYERWAKSWEFQALLKARVIAGDLELGRRYIEAVQPRVWTSAAREAFVESVQKMRERVMEHIPADEADAQLKLGAGGIRDIEFTVQLLQLVHGLTDETIRQRGTLDALDALVAEGYIGRAEAEAFGRDYRMLRVLEHRVQLAQLQRTHLMPRDAEGLRRLARGSRLAETGAGVWELWEQIKREVREIHVRLFYRPLLSAVASVPDLERALSTDEAHDRLAAIGFRDPKGALRAIGALTSGLSRKATIQRHLMPVMLSWFGDGVDPDYGLAAFRRVSERLGDTPWFLRMLRDSSGAAERLTRVLSGSRYIGELMEWIPESVAWLDDPDALRPRSGVVLQEEARAIQSRHGDVDSAMRAVRALRRRELLRTAIAAVLEVTRIQDLADALTTITDVTIQATLRAVRRDIVPDDASSLDFAIIAMGRFGGAELGFGSDADVLYVYRPEQVPGEQAADLARRIVQELRRHSEDFRAPLDLDADLRPEGRNGPLVRTLDSYREYYGRWSLSWEAQALLRARGTAGSVKLIDAFMAVADEVRYPERADPQGLREIRRIKARVEAERLPQGVDRRRHLKLGPGTLSDVEWLVQLLQLEHAHAVPGLRTTSTLEALDAAVEAGLIPEASAGRLRDAWLLSSRLRSANTLLTGRTSDVLPTDRRELDGIGRLLDYAPRSASAVEEDYFRTTRRARAVFEKLFYG